jgi:prepilin-type N-terminal cleavage/methylation domain-containing protein
MKRAFTLIELLVVISIISLLSSVVLSSLQSARNNSRDSAIKSQVLEIRKLMELEFSANGEYANLERGWVETTGIDTVNPKCSEQTYAGNYATNLVKICENIVSIMEASGVQTGNALYTTDNGGIGSKDKYSIMARLSDNRIFCAGSSGTTSLTTFGTWTSPGCYANS